MGLRCFVAMALGREDTDQVYDELIVPALREKGITPVRVDRIEHNEDIDDRIISELGRCHLALADLTYARPSVYFEAGFAQRNVPVIYTCRKDHLKGRADDPYGNFRVHFDLQMKNIIPWSSAEDAGFQERLGKRLRVVIRPLLRDMEARERLQRQVQEFAALSLEQRKERVLGICERRMRAAGYRGARVTTELLAEIYGIRAPLDPIEQLLHSLGGALQGRPRYMLMNRALALDPGWFGTKRTGTTVFAALLHVTPSVTKAGLRRLGSGVLQYPVYDVNAGHSGAPLERLVDELVICTFRAVPQSRIVDVLEDFSFDKDRNAYVRPSEVAVPSEGVFARQVQVYPTGPDSGFIVRNPRLRDPARRALYYAVKGGQLIDPDGGPRGQLTTLPRFTCVHVMHVESEESFSRQLSEVIDHVRATASGTAA